MSETLKLTVDQRDNLVVIYTEGYINNQGGEEIAREAFQLIDAGSRRYSSTVTTTSPCFLTQRRIRGPGNDSRTQSGAIKSTPPGRK